MAAGGVSPKVGKIVDLPANAPTIGTVTDLQNGGGVTVAYTAGDTSVGGPIVNYTATSTPSSISANGASSPITVSGLTVGTSYTFTVKSNNASGSSPLSGSSSAVTPTVPPTNFYNIATLSGSGVSTVTFSSIPSTYKSLQVRVIAKNTTGNDDVLVQLNGDTGSNYAFHYLYGNGSTAAAGAGASQTYMNIPAISPNSTTNYGVGVFDLIDYTSTTKYKTARTFTGNDRNGSGNIWLASGLWMSTSAVTSMTLYSTNTWSTGTSFALYGIN